MGSTGKRLPLSLRRPRTILGIALVLIVVLGYFGRNVEDKLNPSSLDVPGTDANRANKLLRQYFGDSAPFAILLQGPPKAIEEQGPALVHALRASDPKVTTVSPWDKGKVGNLRPAPNKALILADFHVSVNDAVRYKVDELNEILEEKVTPPVEATQTGFATLSRAIQDESIAASERSELIALPVLLLVLLLVFRSPVAALIPLSFGAITVISSRGILALISGTISIDGFALVVSTMMGLALGVDYALLMVSRFREELAGGAETLRGGRDHAADRGPDDGLRRQHAVPGDGRRDPDPARRPARLPRRDPDGGRDHERQRGDDRRAGAAGAARPQRQPLADRQAGSRPTARAVMTFVDAALRRPILAAVLIGGIVLVLAAPAIGLKTGPPSTEQLPSSNDVRQDFDVVQEAIGPGYEAPFVVVAATEDGTMTERSRLNALAKWQRKIAEDPAVQAVIGPEEVAKKTAPLKDTGNELRTSNKKGGELYELNRLGPGLDAGRERRLADPHRLRPGGRREPGCSSEGSGNAEEGALRIADGLGKAIAGGHEAESGIGELNKGAEKVTEGQEEAAGRGRSRERQRRERRSNNSGGKNGAERRSTSSSDELEAAKEAEPELAKAPKEPG